jgi:hypothetical protein
MVSSLTLSALVFALAFATPLTWAGPLSDNFLEQGKRFHSIPSVKYGTRDSKIKENNTLENEAYKYIIKTGYI